MAHMVQTSNEPTGLSSSSREGKQRRKDESHRLRLAGIERKWSCGAGCTFSGLPGSKSPTLDPEPSDKTLLRRRAKGPRHQRAR